jgi:Peptidase A4 family
MRTRWFRAALILVVAAATALGGLAMPAEAVTAGYSGNWSGLVSTGGGYNDVTADVTIPRVTGSCGNGAHVVGYIGLGGWSALPFVQNGFTVTPAGASVWSEEFDRFGNGPVTGVKLPVRPGDRLRLRLRFNADRSILDYTWQNLTLRKTVTRRVTNAGRYFNGSTADYVVERAWYPFRGAPLGHYTPVTFTNAKAARRGVWIPAYNSGSVRVTMLGATGRTISHVTAAKSTTFTTGWSGCR